MDEDCGHNSRSMEKNKNVTVGIVSITRRDQGMEFERERRLSEEVWLREIERWQKQRIRNRRPKRCVEGTSFISMDGVVWSYDIGRDGVHMKPHGYRKFYEKIGKYIGVMIDMREEAFSNRQGGERYEEGVQQPGGRERVRQTRHTWVRENADEMGGEFIPRSREDRKN